MTAPGNRVLIANADDFGQTEGVNRGIARAHEEGIVTSASLLVRFPAAADAARYARRHPDLSVGLHVDFGEWAYRHGRWGPVYDVAAVDAGRAATEIDRQLAAFRRLLGDDPTHIDSHQHAHQDEPVQAVVLELGDRIGVPVRHYDPRIRYCGDFYGQGRNAAPFPQLITVEALIRIVRSLAPGVTELGCHPGEAAGLDSGYAGERERELATLCDPRVREALEQERVELRSFRDAFTAS